MSTRRIREISTRACGCLTGPPTSRAALQSSCSHNTRRNGKNGVARSGVGVGCGQEHRTNVLTAVNVELGQDVLDMAPDGVDADAEGAGDLPVGETLDQHHGDIRLTLCEPKLPPELGSVGAGGTLDDAEPEVLIGLEDSEQTELGADRVLHLLPEVGRE